MTVAGLPEWVKELGATSHERHARVLEVVCPLCAADAGELCRRGNPFGRAAPNAAKHTARWTEAALDRGVVVPVELVEKARRDLREAIKAYELQRNRWERVAGVRLVP